MMLIMKGVIYGVVNSKVGRFGLFLANPMVAKVDKVNESGEPSCQVGSIVRKTLFLLLLTIVGVAVFFLTSSMVPESYIEAEGYDINVYEAAIACGALFLGAIGTWLYFKFVRSAALFGSIYSFGQGYAVAFLCHILVAQYVYPCLITLGLTILIVIAMLLLYQLHLVRIDRKFVSVLLTLICVGLLLALGVYVMNMIPATKEYAKYIMDNSAIVIGAAAVGIVVASLFLLVDFEVINHSVETKLPKKYEWLSSYALSFSIIEIYLKVLNFIIQLASNKNKETA